MMTKHNKVFKRQFALITQFLVNTLSNLLGQDAASMALRRTLLRAAGLKIGYGTAFHGGSRVLGTRLSIGKHCFINRDCYFDLSAPIVIGNNVYVGHRTTFITAKHDIGPAICRAGKTTSHPITVGDGTWIGANVTILPGITLGRGAVIATGAVVTKDVGDNTVVAGVPAKFVKQLPL